MNGMMNLEKIIGKKFILKSILEKDFQQTRLLIKLKKIIKINKEAYSSKYFHKIFYIILTIFVLFIHNYN